MTWVSSFKLENTISFGLEWVATLEEQNTKKQKCSQKSAKSSKNPPAKSDAKIKIAKKKLRV